MRTYHSKELNQHRDYLELLSKQFPNVASASSEVINLRAILNLPKGTEHYLTDIHGEFRALNHVLRNGSGVIKRKITDVFGKTLSSQDIKELATLIYYPEEKLSLIRHSTDRIDDWYRITIYRLVQICRVASSKYTRSKVRKALPKDFAYVLEELLHEDEERFNKREYYNNIINTIVDLGRSSHFIIALAKVIQRLTIDHLHIVGDIYDRGPEAHLAMDLLMDYHTLDIQWGNHDILWMGAAAGNDACMANAIRNCLRYANMSILEDGYGINLLPLATFAMNTYSSDPCEKFLPRLSETSLLSDSDRGLLARMHKAITLIQFKLESELIERHPEYKMEHRQLLKTVDPENKTVLVEGVEYPLNDCLFPTINPKNPSELTKEEKQVIEKLRRSFRNSEKLHRHIEFLYAKGSLYQAYNGNLLYHASIPMTEEGEFQSFNFEGESYSGKALMDLFDRLAREAYFGNRVASGDTDFLWFLWCHPLSPIFGKNKMATFERYLIDDPAPHKEVFTPYFKLVNKEENAMKILKEFDLDPYEGHIINGHVPVQIPKGESPIRAKGRLLVIDGGFSKAYRKTTGIAGYTLIYNSYGLQLAAHEPFESIEKAIREGQDIRSTVRVIEKTVERKRVSNTDIGRDLNRQIQYLEMLIAAYRKGIVKEKLK